jgi:hypothetical protein
MHLLFLVALLVACSGSTPTPAQPAPPAPAAAPSAIAPQLFTLEQLRAGNPQGRTIELRMEVDGQPTKIEHWVFTAVDAENATIHAITRDEAGTVLADETGTSTWAELYKHGQFPADATTIEDNVSLTVPAGTFTTRLYTVKAGDTTRRFWFAADLPGPPVQFTTEKAGKVVMRAQMLRAR